MKKGFTLIELLAVIIILAVITLIATPIVLNVVNNAKDSARKSSIAGYADATKLAVYKHSFKENGSLPTVSKDWAKDNVSKLQGSEVVCNDVKYTTSNGTILHQCKVDNYDKEYCFAKGKVYDDCNNKEYKDIYDKIETNRISLAELLQKQYSDTNIKGLLKEGENYYYKGSKAEVAHNFVWYEGHLWRVIQVNSDNTLLMITGQPITAIQPTSAVWATKEQYESSYINTWLNDVFYNSISDKSKILKNTFNVGIYNNVSEITTSQYVGLLDETQYTKAGLANSYLDIKDYFWLGNRHSLTKIRSSYYNGNVSGIIISNANGVRPVVKISDLTITNGDGTIESPFRDSSTSTNTSNVKVGEYISVPGSDAYCSTVTPGRCLFRVISKDNDSVKVILNGFLPATSRFGGVIFSASNTVNVSLMTFANSISTTYRYSKNKTFNIGIYEDGANYTAVSSTTYIGNAGLPVVGEMFSGNDIDVTSTTKTFVNGATIENSTISNYFWTMNTFKLDNIRRILDSGNMHYCSPSYSNGIRPIIFLNLGTSSDLTFTKGEGTAEHPYWLGN